MKCRPSLTHLTPFSLSPTHPCPLRSDAQVLLEAHFDLLCPDCAAAWPVYQQVLAAYGPSKLRGIVHLFPLPYHTWAFAAAFGGNLLPLLNSTADPNALAYSWANTMFQVQANFWNAQTANMTATAVQQAFGQVAQQVAGVDPAAFVQQLNNNADVNMDTRISWKFGCSRGVSGTPTFFVNGILVPADSTWTLAQWQQLLDPLFNSTSGQLAGKRMAMAGRRRVLAA